MRTTEGPAGAGGPRSRPPSPPPRDPSSPVHFNPLFPVTSRVEDPLQPGGDREAGGRGGRSAPSFPSCDSRIIYVVWLGCGRQGGLISRPLLPPEPTPPPPGLRSRRRAPLPEKRELQGGEVAGLLSGQTGAESSWGVHPLPPRTPPLALFSEFLPHRLWAKRLLPQPVPDRGPGPPQGLLPGSGFWGQRGTRAPGGQRGPRCLLPSSGVLHPQTSDQLRERGIRKAACKHRVGRARRCLCVFGEQAGRRNRRPACDLCRQTRRHKVAVHDPRPVVGAPKHGGRDRDLSPPPPRLFTLP